MTLLAFRRTALRHQKAALDAELADWLARSTEKKPLEKQHTQIRGIARRLEGLLTACVADLATEPFTYPLADRVEERLLDVHRVWDFFRNKLAQRDVPLFQDELLCADELAWACYEPARNLAVKHGKVTADQVKEPPLVFFNGGRSPFRDPRQGAFDPADIEEERELDADLTAVVRALPVPLVGLPWFQVRHAPSLVLLAHEVGHVVEDDVKLGARIEELVANAVPEARREAWVTWRHEVFADVYGVLCAGPAFVWALLPLLVGPPEDVEDEERPRADAASPEERWGRYPTRALRLELNLAVLEALGLPADEPRVAWQAEMGKVHAMKAYSANVKPVVAALLGGPYAPLGGVKLTEVITWGAQEQQATTSNAFNLANGIALTTAKVRTLLGAATLAYRDAPEEFAKRNARASVVKAVLAARPPGVRGSRKERLVVDDARTDALDRAAGADLLALLPSSKRAAPASLVAPALPAHERKVGDMPETVAERYETLKNKLRKVKVRGETYHLAEGDLLLDDNQLHDYARRQVAMAEAKAAGVAAVRRELVGILRNNKKVRWGPGVTLTYCVLKKTFPTEQQYETVRDNMRRATRAWERVCGVEFEHKDEHDDEQTVPVGTVLFQVAFEDTGGQLIAAAFFPDDPPARRTVIIDPSYFSTTFDQVGVLRHELGHALGFRHEHIRKDAPAACPNEPLGATINLTDYDPQSVMHYFCGGVGSLTLDLTDVDRQGARDLYGPPHDECDYRA